MGYRLVTRSCSLCMINARRSWWWPSAHFIWVFTPRPIKPTYHPNKHNRQWLNHRDQCNTTFGHISAHGGCCDWIVSLLLLCPQTANCSIDTHVRNVQLDCVFHPRANSSRIVQFSCSVPWPYLCVLVMIGVLESASALSTKYPHTHTSAQATARVSVVYGGGVGRRSSRPIYTRSLNIGRQLAEHRSIHALTATCW